MNTRDVRQRVLQGVRSATAQQAVLDDPALHRNISSFIGRINSHQPYYDPIPFVIGYHDPLEIGFTDRPSRRVREIRDRRQMRLTTRAVIQNRDNYASGGQRRYRNARRNIDHQDYRESIRQPARAAMQNMQDRRQMRSSVRAALRRIGVLY